MKAEHDQRRNHLTFAIIGSSEFRNFEVFLKEVAKDIKFGGVRWITM
ncbi:hypothetical protein IAE16_06895 [Hydrogenobacter sp. T-2]|nr:hypothetical protein [Hydrogenobacter sp. T-2]WPM31544.1 hypothetical protein IAE16_06895 [Hydrogenobacter sp. T-2]